MNLRCLSGFTLLELTVSVALGLLVVLATISLSR
ncbi:Tfp pilus assembly protein PilW [Caballeronia udeis]|uniref:Tfp pilus assembly protein PilW n=1 Tax=Caballeronia udeis TaxID=1232866 RepID=A0ABW8MP21_9BURK